MVITVPYLTVLAIQDFYNFMLDSANDPISMTAVELSKGISMKRYSKYLDSIRFAPGGNGDFDSFMNGVIKKKLQIIPKNIT